jgi:hypothetical protein
MYLHALALAGAASSARRSRGNQPYVERYVMLRDIPRPAYAGVAAAIALFIALGGSGYSAFVATAQAAEIPGDPLHIFADGSGRLQARFAGFAAGELRPSYLDLADQRSGMVFTIYRSGGGASIACGPIFRGKPPDRGESTNGDGRGHERLAV